TFIAMLVCIPAAATLTYFILLLHQSIRNQERFGELQKRKGRRKEFLRRLAEKKRLADPFFHFNIAHGKSVDAMVEEQLAHERGGSGSAPTQSAANPERDAKILKAIEQGRLILLDTELERCGPGMVVGRTIEQLGLHRGDELQPAHIMAARQFGLTTLPVLYNPGRVAGAMAGATA
ncbi:MAG: hypothetical protein HUU29_09430, partial [Planctomycetaceae bacterium]|nr:hypothetical protein [Planctomycetaceae bacterium]